jgi:SAM-dependent methyltransferase
LDSSVRAEFQKHKQREVAFDEQFGVDTIGFVDQTDLIVHNPNQIYAASYEASDPQYFRDAISILMIDYQRFNFIDFGSGKGRAILLATEFPFKKITGVEFSEKLHKIALDNISRFKSTISKCTDVESICMDVVDYPLPNECLVCYFFNPFDATVLAQVISNIQKSLLKNPREIFIVYCRPKEAHIIEQTECFKKINEIGPVSIWQTTNKKIIIS